MSDMDTLLSDNKDGSICQGVNESTGTVQPQQRRLRGILPVCVPWLGEEGKNREDSARLLSVVSHKRIRGNGYRLKYRKFHSNHSSVRVAEHWTGNSRASTCGGTQNSTGHCTDQLSLDDLALTRKAGLGYPNSTTHTFTTVNVWGWRFSWKFHNHTNHEKSTLQKLAFKVSSASFVSKELKTSEEKQPGKSRSISLSAHYFFLPLSPDISLVDNFTRSNIKNTSQFLLFPTKVAVHIFFKHVILSISFLEKNWQVMLFLNIPSSQKQVTHHYHLKALQSLTQGKF